MIPLLRLGAAFLGLALLAPAARADEGFTMPTGIDLPKSEIRKDEQKQGRLNAYLRVRQKPKPRNLLAEHGVNLHGGTRTDAPYPGHRANDMKDPSSP